MEYEEKRKAKTIADDEVEIKEAKQYFDSTSGLRVNMSKACIKEKDAIRIMRIKTPWPCEAPHFYDLEFAKSTSATSTSAIPLVPGEGMCNFERDDLLAQAADAAAKTAIRENVGSNKILWFFAVRQGTVKDGSNMRFYGQKGKSPKSSTQDTYGADAFGADEFSNKRPRI